MNSKIEDVLWETRRLLDSAGINKRDNVELSMAFMVWSYLSNNQRYSTDAIPASKNGVTIESTPDNASLYWVGEVGLERKLEDSIEGAWVLWQATNPKLLEGVFTNALQLIKTIAKSNERVLPQVVRKWENLKTIKPEEYRYHSEFFWIYMHNERPDAHQFYTPSELVDFMLTNLDSTDHQRVLDPFCRSGEFLSAVANRISARRLEGIAPDLTSKKFTQVSNLLFTPDHNMSITDSKLSIDITAPTGSYDYICTNPPFGKDPGEHDRYHGGEWNEFLRVRKLECRYLVKVLNSLALNGKASVVMPISFLAGPSTDSFREKLIKDNLIDAVTLLPSGLFYGTDVSAAVLFLHKNRMRDDVLFIDAREMGYKHKQMHRLEPQEVLEMSDYYKQYIDNSGHEFEHTDKVKVVSRTKMLENRAALQFDRYLEEDRTYTNPFRASEILAEECKSLEEKLAALQADIETLLHTEVKAKPNHLELFDAQEEDPDNIFDLRSRTLNAKARLEHSKRFVVLKNSEMRRYEAKSCPSSAKRVRQQLILDGKVTLSEDLETYIFRENVVFRSASAAAGAITGTSVNGLDAWQNRSHKTLNELKALSGKIVF